MYLPRFFILVTIVLFFPIFMVTQEDISVSEFDTYGRQNNQIINNQRRIISELEKTVRELRTQNQYLSENLSLFSNILITNINYIQNLEEQNSNLNRTLEKMTEVQDRTSKELRNIRLELNRLREAVKELSEHTASQRRYER